MRSLQAVLCAVYYAALLTIALAEPEPEPQLNPIAGLVDTAAGLFNGLVG